MVGIRYYIILQPSIRSMGGEEMYTRNKVISAREQGFCPIVLHGGGGEKVYIDDLKVYEQYEFPEFRYDPCVISRAKKVKLVNGIRELLQDYDAESIIESHEILVAEWGEWLAENLQIRHFAYMLLEQNRISNQLLYDFFKFKYDRHELAGMARKTIPNMFKKYNNGIEGVYLPAYCSNAYEDIPCPDIYRIRNGYCTIGTIGRTNKKFVQPMIDAVVKFASQHNDIRFNFLYIGGSTNKNSEKNVIRRLSSISNVELTFTGMIFPVPVEMIRQMDVCVASAGSSCVSVYCGVPTISIDSNDCKAIGVVNKTTTNITFRGTGEPPIDIDYLLEEILIRKKYQKEDKMELANLDFSSHWRFVNEMSNKKEYFDVNSLQLSFTDKLKSRLLGSYNGMSPSSFGHHLLATIIHWASFVTHH